MNDLAIDMAARLLLEARREGRQLEALPQMAPPFGKLLRSHH